MKKTEIRRQTNSIEKLENALVMMLMEKDISEIKVRELCTLAQVNHQTFYNYYYDQFDLYEEMESKAIDEALLILESGFRSDIDENQNAYIERIKDTKYLIRLLKQKNCFRFKEKINMALFPILEKKIMVMSREKDRKYLTLYVLSGSMSILEEWIKGGCVETSEYIATLMYKIPGSIDIYH